MPNGIPEALAITMYDDVIDKDYTVTEMRKEDCVLCSNRYHIGNSRMALGLVLSSEEYEDFRRRVYSTHLL